MSKSRSEMPLITIGALMALDEKKLSDATLCIQELILHLPEKKLIEEMDFLFSRTKNKSAFLDCIHTKYRSRILMSAIKFKNQSLIELLLKEHLISSTGSDEFCAIVSLLFKNNYVNLAEFTIQIRKEYATKNIANELATIILLVQIDSYPEKYARIRYLHQQGIHPMRKYTINNQPYTLAMAALESPDKKLVALYLEPDFLKTYTEEELVLLFKKMIKESHYFHAELLLKEKQFSIIKNLKQSDFDLLILNTATSENRHEIENLQNLIYFFLKNGANPITHLRLNNMSAFPIYGLLYEIFNKDNLNQYSPEDLIFVMKDCLQTPHYLNKQNILQLILSTKKELLTKYFSLNQNVIDELLFHVIKLKDDTLITSLLTLGADPLNIISYNRNALIIALNHQYYFAVKTILENKIGVTSADHLAAAFKVAAENKWLDLASLIASERNPWRKETMEWLLHDQTPEFIRIILEEKTPDHQLLVRLCESKEIDVDQKTPPSLLHYALTNHASDMIKAILTHHFHKLSPKRTGDAIADLLEHQESHGKDIIFIKTIGDLKTSNHEKKEIACRLFLKAIQRAESIQDVMMIPHLIKTSPANFTYFNTFLNKEMRQITHAAIARINAITKEQTELVFTDQQLTELLQFLDNSTSSRLFYNPKEDFMQLAKNKIQMAELAVSNLLVAG